MMHLWTIEWEEPKYRQRKIILQKIIKGENISLESSGLSKREWNELIEAFSLKDKML